MASRYEILRERKEPEKRPIKKKQAVAVNSRMVRAREKALDAARGGDCSDHKCPRGGDHEWGTDGVHGNGFCIKCFVDKSA